MVTKARVRQWLEERFFLRIHMTIILGGTFVAGVVTTRVLMGLGVNLLALRYAIAVSLAYLVFLVLVKLWLLYVGSDTEIPDPGDALELALPDGSSAHVPGVKVSSGSGGGGSSFDLAGDLGGDLDGVFLIVLIVVVLLIGGLAIYFIYTAPVLLSEAAFEAVLAASIARRAKRAEGAGWLGAVLRATLWPFLGVLALSTFLGWFAQHRCPDATRLRDAIVCSSARQGVATTRRVVFISGDMSLPNFLHRTSTSFHIRRIGANLH